MDVVKDIDNMQRVGELQLKGYNEKEISQETGLTPVRVKGYLSSWRNYLETDRDLRSEAKGVVQKANAHFERIIKEAYSLNEDAKIEGSLRERGSSLKLIADIEKSRVDMIHKAGLAEDDELAKQLEETEKKHEILTAILKDITNTCARCRPEVHRRLAEAAGQVPEAVIVVDE